MNAKILQILQNFLSNTSSTEEIQFITEILQQGTYWEEWEYVLFERQNSATEKEPALKNPPDFQKLFDQIKSKTST